MDSLMVFDDDGALLGEQNKVFVQDMHMWRTNEGPDWLKFRSRNCGDSFDVELTGEDQFEEMAITTVKNTITREQARGLCNWLEQALGYR